MHNAGKYYLKLCTIVLVCNLIFILLLLCSKEHFGIYKTFSKKFYSQPTLLCFKLLRKGTSSDDV